MTEGRVLGTGIDLVETGRMQEVLGRWGQAFRNRVFLPEEQAYCDSLAAPWRHYAGRFAVKEAVSKAFGTGIGPAIGLLDMEVVRDAVTESICWPNAEWNGFWSAFRIPAITPWPRRC